MERLSDYCHVISGYAFKSADLKVDGDVPVIKIGNISNGGNISINNETQYVESSFLALNPKYHIKNGDIIISLTGSHMNQPNSMVGRSCRSYTSAEYLLNQRAGKVIAKKNADVNYLYYLLQTQAIKYAIVNRAYGAANQVNVSPSDVEHIKWDFPSYKVQQKIGTVLSTYDDLIEKNNRKIAILQEQAQEIYKEWFVRFRFPGHESAKFENGLPVGWEVARIKDCVKRLPFNRLYKEYELDTEGLVVVIDQSEKEQLGFHNNEPSHIASYKQPICLFGDHSCKFKLMTEPFSLGENVVPFIGNGIDTYYLFYATHKIIETEEYKRHWGLFVSKKTLIPSKELQQKFASKAEHIKSQIDCLNKKNRLLAKQRDLLLPRLMSGKLEV